MECVLSKCKLYSIVDCQVFFGGTDFLEILTPLSVYLPSAPPGVPWECNKLKKLEPIRGTVYRLGGLNHFM